MIKLKMLEIGNFKKLMREGDLVTFYKIEKIQVE